MMATPNPRQRVFARLVSAASTRKVADSSTEISTMAQVNQGALHQIFFREPGSGRSVPVRTFQGKGKSWKLENGHEVVMAVDNVILMTVNIGGSDGSVEVRPRGGTLTKEQALEDICDGILKVRALLCARPGYSSIDSPA